ncbi:MAG: insulinase family protein, partial [Muribaculaceae bacterium]|nr:insulinase family protein [Muribaculaceae bacterium]
QVIVVSQPLNDNTNILKEEEVIAALEATINAPYEAYVDEVITEPLIEKLPAPGSIKSTSKNDVMGTTEFILSNGVKVILKTTDFKADEIGLTAFRKGGKQTYSKDQAADVLLMPLAVELSKLGNFDINMMKKYLAGKTVSLGYSVNNYTDMLEGSSSVKDFGSMMEVLYAYFTALNPDEEKYQTQIEQYKPILANNEKLPNSIFARERAKTTYGDNPLMANLDVATLEKANYSNMLSMAKKSLENAADYTFIFVGNIDEATLRPMLEQYIATLPSKAKASECKVVTNIDPVRGKVENKFDVAMQTPSTIVFNMYSGNNLKWDVKNDLMIDLMGDVLDMVFVETLREDEGGTYGASVSALYNFSNNIWQLIYAYQTAEDKLERMEARADKELEDLLKNGAKADHFNKVKEAAIKQYEINSKTNSYWEGAIMSAERGANTYAGYIEALQSLTLDEFNNFLKNVYDGKNLIEVIMIGKQAAE